MGKETKIFVRFSTTAPSKGACDAVRDFRGFAIKFYTNEGNIDLVGGSQKSFVIRDPALFPHLNHAVRSDPQTGYKNQNYFWDFMSQQTETTSFLVDLFSPKGMPSNFRTMAGYSINLLKFVNKDGKPSYCKLTWLPVDGEKFLTD